MLAVVVRPAQQKKVIADMVGKNVDRDAMSGSTAHRICIMHEAHRDKLLGARRTSRNTGIAHRIIDPQGVFI